GLCGYNRWDRRLRTAATQEHSGRARKSAKRPEIGILTLTLPIPLEKDFHQRVSHGGHGDSGTSHKPFLDKLRIAKNDRSKSVWTLSSLELSLTRQSELNSN